MRLSTELLLTNLVLLGALWYVALHGMLITAVCLLIAMFVVRHYGLRASRKEMIEIQARIKTLLAKIKAKQEEKQ